MSKAGNLTDLFDGRSVACVWSTSSQYELPQRVLFYVLLLVAVFARSHKWLIMGALGFALTFSGAAALHAIALAFVRAGNGSDPDLLQISSILDGSAIFAIPLIHWSTAIRRFRARAVSIAWLLLIFTGIGAVWYQSQQTVTSTLSHFSCDFDASNCSMVNETDYSFGPWLGFPNATYFTHDAWKRCRCQSTCNQHMEAAFRSGSSSLASVLLIRKIRPGLTTAWLRSNRAQRSASAGALTLFFFVQLFVGLYLRGNNPSYLRQKIYSGLLRSSFLSDRVRPVVAKYIALVVHLQVCLLVIVCPVTFAFMVIGTETVNFLIEIPNEPYDAVGQWSPWAHVFLIVLAALINRFGSALMSKIRKIWRRLQHLIWPQRYPEDRGEAFGEQNLHSGTAKSVRDTGRSLFHMISGPLIIVVPIWADGRRWFIDPDSYREQQYEWAVEESASETRRLATILPLSEVKTRDGNADVASKYPGRRWSR